MGLILAEVELEYPSMGETQVLVFRLALRDADLDLDLRLSIESPSFTIRPFLIENERSL